jgi:hypothetical protein
LERVVIWTFADREDDVVVRQPLSRGVPEPVQHRNSEPADVVDEGRRDVFDDRANGPVLTL